MDNKKNARQAYLGWFAKRIALVAYDVVAVNLAYWFALIIRFYVNMKFMPSIGNYIPAFWSFAPWYSIACVIVFACFKLYGSMWKYAGIYDLNRVVLANIVTAIVQVVGTLIFVMRMPITYYVLGAGIQFLLIAVGRFAYRVFVTERARIQSRKQATINTMIIGVGETGRIVRKKIEEDRNNVARLVCVFTAKPYDAAMVDGIPVATGMEKFKEYLKKYQVACVILADSIMLSEERKLIKKVCAEENIEVQDFSGYFQYEGTGITLKRQLEYVTGPVELIIDGESQLFSNGEAAMMAVQGNYQVKAISTKKEHIVIEVSQQKVVLNNTDEDWVKEYEQNTGEEISFF